MSNTEKTKATLTRSVWKGFTKNIDDALTVAIVQVFVRAVAIAPVVLVSKANGKLPSWVGWTATAVLYILLAMPLRCWGGEKLRRMFYSRHKHEKSKMVYSKWLKAELARLLRGIIWGLPFLVCMGYYFYGKSYMHYTDMYKPVMNLAVLIGKEPDMAYGLPMAAAMVTVFALLFAYGWWRNEMLEYLPIRSMELDRCFRWAGRIRRHYRGQVVKNTLVNILLTLPALICFSAVLVYHFMKSVVFSGGIEIAFQMILRVMRKSLPSHVLLILAAIGVLVYLPLCLFRKMRIAALAGKLMKSASSGGHHHHEHSEHHELNPAPAVPEQREGGAENEPGAQNEAG